MLSTDEIKQIVDACKAHAGEDFYISPKQHYDTHARLDRLLDIFDRCESQAWKFVIGLTIVIGFGVSVIWSAVHK